MDRREKSECFNQSKSTSIRREVNGSLWEDFLPFCLFYTPVHLHYYSLNTCTKQPFVYTDLSLMRDAQKDSRETERVQVVSCSLLGQLCTDAIDSITSTLYNLFFTLATAKQWPRGLSSVAVASPAAASDTLSLSHGHLDNCLQCHLHESYLFFLLERRPLFFPHSLTRRRRRGERQLCIKVHERSVSFVHSDHKDMRVTVYTRSEWCCARYITLMCTQCT